MGREKKKVSRKKNELEKPWAGYTDIHYIIFASFCKYKNVYNLKNVHFPYAHIFCPMNKQDAV